MVNATAMVGAARRLAKKKGGRSQLRIQIQIQEQAKRRPPVAPARASSGPCIT